ncbi:unnamed protein product [Brassicogethes aeneus]|uniref:Uncharacterized protein n=1 Tax=Brassicogethes aeneus TaxID=1431903 RepID=A0A9P0ANZ8_BRAAE|nr:unnamed protein product [Brassicogethes aeneus]
MGSKRTSNDTNVNDEDKENYKKVPKGLSNNNKTSPGVLLLYQANVIDNPVFVNMNCLTNITPVTFPDNDYHSDNTGVIAADNLNLDMEVDPYPSEKPAFTEFSNVIPDNSTVVVENITGIESNFIIVDLTNQKNKGKNCPDFHTVSTLEDNLYEPKSGNNNKRESSDNPDYQPEVDDINAYVCDIKDNPLIAKEVEDEDSDSNIEIIETEYTKKGALRKRKKYKYSVTERREKSMKKMKRKHNVLEGCGETCRKKCRQNIIHERRIDINKQFWNMNRHDQKNFVMGCIVTGRIKRKTVEESRRLSTNKYYLKNEEGQSIPICKTFFLTTLGYKKSNDKIIESIMEKNKSIVTPKKDKRRGKSPPNKKKS